jgi:hypothetical protein
MITAGVLHAQDYYPTSQNYSPSASYGAQLFSAEELDNLVAPVALYPDAILAQVFVAATFADQVDIAARHVRMFGTGSIDVQPWDLSVKAVAWYPPVLNMLAERGDWTAAVGQAYAVQPDEVMDAVQRLRWMARRHGNLSSTNEQTVIIEREVVRIVPAQPRVIYVPVYEPAVVYYRPIVFHAGIRTPHWSFGVAFPIGSWLSYDCNWYTRRVYYDGWSGDGWRRRSLPFIQVVNVYVHPRHKVVNINHTIVNKTVNYVNLGRNTAIHRDARFTDYSRKIAKVADVPARVHPVNVASSANVTRPANVAKPRDANVALSSRAAATVQSQPTRATTARPQTPPPSVQTRQQTGSASAAAVLPRSQATPPSVKPAQARSQAAAVKPPQVQSRPAQVQSRPAQVQSRPTQAQVQSRPAQVQSRPTTVQARPTVVSQPPVQSQVRTQPAAVKSARTTQPASVKPAQTRTPPPVAAKAVVQSNPAAAQKPAAPAKAVQRGAANPKDKSASAKKGG